jgi:superfamily II DNA or RNA helicase
MLLFLALSQGVTSMNNFISTGQGRFNEPEEFQAELIKNITNSLRSAARPPCLLRAPTASGKTFMMLRILANMGSNEQVIWFWFAPFTTIVTQTQDAILSNSSVLSPTTLEYGLNQEPEANQVLISTASAVSSAKERNKDYDGNSDDERRSLSQFVNLAKVRGIKIGVVIDEAHIGLDKGTEFGKFINWLNPEFILMATATPKDPRINEFLVGAGKSSFKNFSVSRDDVVKARLNKTYVKAFVYEMTDKVKSVADLKMTAAAKTECNT